MFIRFLMSGGVNTVITYALYLVFIQFLPYKISYTITFTAGIVLAYSLNRFFVFRVKASLSKMGLFPFIYLIQYFLGLGVVVLWVEVLHWQKELAPLSAVITTIPVTFILSRLLFLKKDLYLMRK